MTIKEAAAHAGVCEAVVRSWVRSKELTHSRLGASGRRGKIAIKLEDLEAFLASRRVEKPSVIAAPSKTAKVRCEFKHLRVK